MKTLFPTNFVWGAATASYQIEGAVAEDGRGPSIWDTFSHTPGKIINGDTGDVACDHYHRWREDIQLMQELGLSAYRFSVAWPRIIPQGTGAINTRGLDFYDRLVDGLLAANITPHVTLFHWDLPQALQDLGGWVNRATVDAFEAYTEAVVGRLGDRVKHWITHNEPGVVAFIGHLEGRHAPGDRDMATALQVGHHLLLSHGRAVPIIRAASPGAEVGITLSLSTAQPASNSLADQQAAQLLDRSSNRWFLDPLYGRGYPTDVLHGALLPTMEPNDLAEIAVPTDFLGINYYFPTVARAVPTRENPRALTVLSSEELAAQGYELTAMDWPVVPAAFTELLRQVHHAYRPQSIYILENGAAFEDQVVQGVVHDPRRLAYIHSHLEATATAIAAGVPVSGYFAWSLLDNFEWSEGYSKRFGLIYVDYATQTRIPKTSARWYQQVISSNALVDPSEFAQPPLAVTQP